MDKHSLLCFHGVEPFAHFHGLGTSSRFHDVGIIMLLDTEERISTIFYASMVQDPFHDVGTSPRFHDIEIIVVLDTQL